MINTYNAAMDFVQTRKAAGIRYDLTRMERLMEEIRHPERKVKTIHVAGTNGKGSTVTFLRSILQESGMFVGTYMTPVPGDYRHQMAVNNEPMSEEEFVNVLSEIESGVLTVEEEMGEMISEFELITAMSFYFFSFKKPVDLAIIETGMGGRNDATNVITPLVSIITNVSLDHQAFLGETVEEIASEKAGIIKAGVPVMTSCGEHVLPVLQGEAKQKKSAIYRLEEKVHFHTFLEEGVQKIDYEAPYRNLKNVTLGMLGDHQGKNAALAIMTLDYLKQFYAVMVDDEDIITGVKNAILPGRNEIVNTNPTIVLDTAHNPDAIAITIESMKKMYNNKEIHILFSAMKDKDYMGMIRQLQELSNHVYITTFQSERAMDVSQFSDNDTVTVVNDPFIWLKDWKGYHHDEVLLITGSNQFIGEVRNILTPS
ncbi:dihydrofolate synthase/folylpolyglutamate synthase [Evansella vedderi]|uniref:tetrahydrofolate synthase n=1 Tax=Evansella vedderi TaxID=38282 RepID=A0ABT9ZZ35_9BACI|nr:folylpolyglutamate synthase/dihydrofolate synthase family protein [Evansella vedderi]MDQ0256506.1 dihydrofolate synthase/folylpolyglutamate synthase [Evansella vedderi]